MGQKEREFIMTKLLKAVEEIRDRCNALLASFVEKAEETPVKEEKEGSEAAPEEVVVTPAAGTVEANGEAKARKGSKGGINKSQLIRDYFSKHGMEIRNVDLIAAIKKSYPNIKISPANVSIIRAKMASAPKAKKVKVKEKTVVKAIKQEAGVASLPMPALVCVLLKKHRDGLKLGELSSMVRSSGYKYKGKKGPEGLTQNVYQALHNLSKKSAHPGYEGKVSVVIHDETSKRYRLNPKASFKKNVA